jgi:hypothetical protein
MNCIKIFLGALLVLGVPHFLCAQPVNVQQFNNIQQAQQFQKPLAGLNVATNAPELFPSEVTDTGPQQILRYTPRTKYFDVLLDSQLFYSDNANFAEGSAVIGSAVYVNTLQAVFTPPDLKIGSGKFAPAAGYIGQWYNYDNNLMSSMDFYAQTFFLGGRYFIGNWQIGAGANFTRLLDQADYRNTYEEFLPALSINRVFKLHDRLLFVVGNQISYHFSTQPKTPGVRTDINDRFDESVNLTLSWMIVNRLVLQPFYRFQFSNYRFNTLQNSDRNDYLHSYGVTLSYNFSQNFSARTFFNANYKKSDDPFTPAYREMNEGLGVALNFKF